MRALPAGRWTAVVGALVLALGLGRAEVAVAGPAARITELSVVATSSASEKERLSAVTALAKLEDRRALRPLVTALADRSELVRAVAATALGRLGHKAALPALRQASADGSVTVRKRAREAYAKVCKANGLPVDLPSAAAMAATAPPPPPPRGRAGFGTSPRAIAPRPDLYVVVKGATDESPGKADARSRAANAAALRSAMQAALRSDASITGTAAEARRFGLEARQLDLSVVKLEHRVEGGNVAIEAQLRLSISDDRGRMLSFVSGGAIVNVARRTFSTKALPSLRAEALTGAVDGLFAKLVGQLRRGPRS
ncbi:MAG: HEAT repeat domain-containing protein [Kofleriaceae bacterium]